MQLEATRDINALCLQLQKIPLDALRAIRDLPATISISAVHALQEHLRHRMELPEEHAGLIVSLILKVRGVTPG